jgi:TetR/AcrR family transcriptional repressor of nem operon
VANSEAAVDPESASRALLSPPARGGGREPGKRERLVTAAKQVLYEHGVERSTLADIAVAADVPVGNVYYYFKTKDALVSAVIGSYQDTFGGMIEQLNREDGPAGRLKALLQALTERRERLASYGCPIGSLSAELDKRDDGLRTEAGSILAGLIDWAEVQFRAMGRMDAREQAVALIAAYEGIVLIAAALGDPGLIGAETDRLSRWIESMAEPHRTGPQ